MDRSSNSTAELLIFTHQRALSTDYDPTLDASIQFFKTVQNKVHWAITGKTAAEIIHTRVSSDKDNMGLSNWRGSKVRKQDVANAKNYLSEEEIGSLNNLVDLKLAHHRLMLGKRQALQPDWSVKSRCRLAQKKDRTSRLSVVEEIGKASQRLGRCHGFWY